MKAEEKFSFWDIFQIEEKKRASVMTHAVLFNCADWQTRNVRGEVGKEGVDVSLEKKKTDNRHDMSVVV